MFNRVREAMRILHGSNWTEVLAKYNAEVSRGLVHTDEWKQQMATLQTQWNQIMSSQTGILGRYPKKETAK